MKTILRDKTSESIVIGFAGDFVPGYPQYTPIRKNKAIVELMKSCDFVIANLESALTEAASAKTKGSSLFSQPASIREFKECNISIVNLANNHIMDRGIKGLTDTFNYLEQDNISFFGAGNDITAAAKPFMLAKNGVKAAFLAYSYIDGHVISTASEKNVGANPLMLDKALEQISALKSDGNVVCVSYHGGEEFFRFPAASHRNLMRQFAQAGADIIIGHHQHLFGGIECRSKAVIAYGLGNFFITTPYQNQYKGTHLGLFLTVEVDKVGPVGFSPHFVKIDDSGRSLELLNGLQEKPLQDLLNSFSTAIVDEKKYLQQWRLDCLRCITGMNYRGYSAIVKLFSKVVAVIMKQLLSVVRKRERINVSRNTNESPCPAKKLCKSSTKEKLLAGLFPDGFLKWGQLTHCYRVYNRYK
jgi:poly-gamma-glutamate synthesis protein (capsule biosynthesis protein)